MEQAVFYGALVVMILSAIYIYGSKKGNFVRSFSRGAYMRELNKKIEGK